jgi:hypothetical protein
MTLSAPTRRRRPRGSPSANTTRLERAGSTAPEGTLSAAPAGPSRVVLMVDFASPEGRNWWAVGIGDTHADAVASAQDSCPTDTTWRPLDSNDLYGH